MRTCYHRFCCDEIRNAQEYRLEDQVIWFLIDLNDTFSVVKTQVLLIDLLPLINRIYSLVVQEESNHKNITPIEDNSILVHATHKPDFKHKNGYSNVKNSHRVCTFCHKSGHAIDFCYQNHGHPNFKKKSRINGSHIHANVSSSLTNVVHATFSPRNHVPISQTQYDKLITLLQQSICLPQSHPLSLIRFHQVNHVLF